jgi:peptidoglycan-associated lipoprotein
MRYFLLIALIPLVLLSNAQDGTKQKNVQKYAKAKPAKKMRIGKKKFEEGSYYIAAQYLDDVVKAKPEKHKAIHMLAEANRVLRDYEQAEKFYKMSVDKDAGKFPNDQFYLAQMLKYNGKYEDAKKAFDSYLKSKLDDGEANYKSIAKVEILGCDSALELVKNPTKVKVELAKGAVNTAIQDYSPKPVANGVLFSSQKTDTAVNISSSTADHYSSIFLAEKQGNEYKNRTALPVPPNDSKTHTGNAIISGDGNLMIYTKCDQSPLIKMHCKLYQIKKEGGNWGTPAEIKNLNSTTNTSTQPAFGLDKDGNNILYFVSDKGNKGLDIYYAQMNADGTYGSAVNAGPEVNTPGDDLTPFYDIKSKTLWFSSNGHPSIGGLDIFKITGTPGNWGTIRNAGVPINSPSDDLYLSIDEKGSKGFLVSNRVGSISTRGKTCCDDIYTVVFKPEVTLKGIYVKRGDATNTPVQGVDASLYKVAGNNFEFVGNTITTSNPFTFTVKPATTYKLNGNKEGFWPSIDNLTIAADEDRDTIDQIFYIDPIIKKKIRVPNIYFAFDKSNVIMFYQQQVDSVYGVLMQNPGFSVEIQGHTDSKGTDKYNDDLSVKRANEAKKYLVKKGIADARIVVKTFGEKAPAVPNELPNGEDDPEGRAKNRRVEFKIIPDKSDENLEFESYGEVVTDVKTGPGFKGKTKK